MSDWSVIVLFAIMAIETWVSDRKIKRLEEKVLILEASKIMHTETKAPK